MNPTVISAGGLIVTCRDNQWNTVLVGSGNPTIWRIPKGMSSEGETLEQTAEREVLEETGIRARVVRALGNTGWTYMYDSKDWDETAFFFLMEMVDGDIEDHDDEFEYVNWFRLEEAGSALHYEVEAEIAERARVLMTTGFDLGGL